MSARASWWRCWASTAPGNPPLWDAWLVCCDRGREHPFRGPIHRRQVARADRPSGHLAGARRTRHLSQPDRGGEPAPGRFYPPNAKGEYRRDLEEQFRALPGARRSACSSPAARCPAASSSSWPSHAPSCPAANLLMLDEPSLGLAPALVDQIFELDRPPAPARRDHPARRAKRRPLAGYRRPGLLLNTGLIETSGTREQLRTHADIEGIYMGVKPISDT